ncbi:MAG: hypothetical protein Ct9H300mP7_0160 [Verrucomicrobiota bacterium]|nr:MAG: hypothetical protein Ct9H300mP7_0160 [Verrucomicrobiota bacterium]
MTSPEDFDAIVRAFNYPNFSYADSLSNAYRINFTPRVFSAKKRHRISQSFYITRWLRHLFIPVN